LRIFIHILFAAPVGRYWHLKRFGSDNLIYRLSNDTKAKRTTLE